MPRLDENRSLTERNERPVLSAPQIQFGGHGTAYDPEMDAADGGWNLLVKLWRRKFLIGSTVLAFGVVAALAGQMITPRYKAETQVLVGGPQSNVTQTESVYDNSVLDSDAIRTEGHIIASRTTARQVSSELSLDSHPIFNPALAKDESLMDRLGVTRFVMAVRDYVSAVIGTSETAGAETAESKAGPSSLTSDDRIISKLLSGLTVEPMSRSDVLRIVAETEDPDLSARIANGFANVYVAHRLEEQEAAVYRANQWLDDRLSSLQSQLADAEQAVESYRRENNLFSVRSDTVVGQQLAELNRRLVEARTDLSDAEARLVQAESMAAYAGESESIPAVLQSPLIISLRTEKSALERKAAEIRSEYTDKHPKMVAVNAQLSDIDTGIGAEIDRIVSGLRQESDIAQQRLDRVEARMTEVETAMGTSNKATVELRQLEREADAIRAMYEGLLIRSKETSFQSGLLEPGAEILSDAVVPTSPSFPPNKLIIVVGILAGLSAGVILALIVEKLDHTFRTPEELEEYTGIPSLAVLPRTARRWSGKCDEVVRNPLSPYTDALRMLWAQLSLTDCRGDITGVTLFTSAVPGEGKSFTSCSYARLMAAEGKKVVLVDLDWRQPTQHRLFGEKFRRTDMLDLLNGDVLPEEVVHVDRRTGLHVIFNGRLGNLQGRAVSLERILALLKTLSNYYDLVVVDTSPLHITPMVLHLARAVDRVVLCVKWGSTRRQAVSSEVRNLLRAGVRVSGTVITQVEPKKYRRYSDGSDHYVRTPVLNNAA